MQLSRVIITYLIIWDELALNDARMVKIALGEEIFVFGKVGEVRKCVMSRVYDLSNVALLKWRSKQYLR